MRVAAYARVSTTDKDQDPETQLLALREYCESQGWQIVEEFVDEAPGQDLAARIAWRKLLDDASRRRFQAVVVFKLDRAFRGVKDMHDTLATWELVGVALKSVREQFDTTTPIGRLLLTLLAALAEFELDLIRERVRAGMARARKQGKQIGRPSVRDKTFMELFGQIADAVLSGSITKTEAAAYCGVSRATLNRELAHVDR